ncbi:MAG TPA: hypothetical protein PKL92_04870 [Aquaticitalea sp.]|nr:hypothetical protein [Aquaticitalea sp.]HNU58479.1 hypothetical protein [Aquaticitalea sp.]
MAQSDWEQHIKETMENRQLQPSQDAWHKLQNRLDASEKKKNNTTFWKLGIAAGIVGILFASVLFIDKKVHPENTVVTIPVTKVETDKEAVIIENSIQIASENTTRSAEKQNFETNVQEVNKTVAETLQSNDFQLYENEKIDAVIAQVHDMVEKNNTISENELDSLLLLAEQELKAYKLLTSVENQTVTNPVTLLAEAENELDNSFRSRVLDKLLSGFESIKEVVVSRKN